MWRWRIPGPRSPATTRSPPPAFPSRRCRQRLPSDFPATPPFLSRGSGGWQWTRIIAAQARKCAALGRGGAVAAFGDRRLRAHRRCQGRPGGSVLPSPRVRALRQPAEAARAASHETERQSVTWRLESAPRHLSRRSASMADEIDPLAARMGLILDYPRNTAGRLPRSGSRSSPAPAVFSLRSSRRQGLRPTTTS